MWIRSQGKKMLVEVKRIEIAKYLDEGYRILNQHNYIDGMDDFDILGKYESEERAIEVLDEIQKHIELIGHNRLLINQPEEQYNYEYYIFQMPEK